MDLGFEWIWDLADGGRYCQMFQVVDNLTLLSPNSLRLGLIMDKKTKKKIDVLRKRIEKTQQQVAGAKLQPDEPDEVENLQKEIAKMKEEIERLKAS